MPGSKNLMTAKRKRWQPTSQIDVANENDLKYWSASLELTVEQLKQAVAEAGTSVADVRRYLERNRDHD